MHRGGGTSERNTVMKEEERSESDPISLPLENKCKNKKEVRKPHEHTSTGEDVTHRHSRDADTEMGLSEHKVFSCLD